MKKAVILVSLLLIASFLAWLFFFSGAFSRQPRLLRFSLGEPGKWNEESIRAMGFSPPLRSGNNSFFETGNFSLRGNLLHIAPGGRRFTLQPGVQGKYICMLNVYLAKPQNLGLQVFLERKREMLLQRLHLGDNPVRLQLDLERNSRIHIVFTGTGSVLAGEVLLSAAIPIPQRDYVFLFSADTLRADHLPIYGYERNTAPHISAFARDAVLFENAYAQSSWTLPSHMSLFTGRNEYAHGVKRGSRLSPSIPFLVEDISDRTVTRSINGGIYVSSRFGFSRGFDSFFSIPKDQLDPLATHKLVNRTAASLTRDFLAEGFYFLHTYQVHSPYNPAEKYLTALKLNPREKSLIVPTVPSNHREQFLSLDPEKIQNYIDLYDAEILALDEGFGKFLEFLKNQGIYQRSMIIFFSDHGEEFFDHNGWGHGHSLYNELIRVPLLVKFPGNRFAGRRQATPAGLVDIMPTIMEHYKLSPEHMPLDGCTLTQIIKDGSRKKPLISSLTSGRYVPELPFKISIVEGSRKLIYNLPYTAETLEFFEPDPPEYQRYEVYDIAEDHKENQNIHTRFRKWSHSFRELFRTIVNRARANLLHTERKVIMDEEMKEAFKSLGYL